VRKSSVEVVEAHAQRAPHVRSFDRPRALLGQLDAEATATLLSAAADVSLVLDADGSVLDVSFGSQELAGEGFSKWIGQPLVDTVAPDSRTKVQALLRDAALPGLHRARHINHISFRGPDVPVLYSAVKVGSEGRIVAFGRDLRDMATLQQRLVDAQQSLERDYWRLRNVETRYRTLFQMSSEAILIVDANSERVLEANPTAGELFGENARRMTGRSLSECVGAESVPAVQALMASVRTAGRADDVLLRFGPDRRELLASVVYFRQGTEALFLLRLSVPRADAGASPQTKAMLRALEHAPDGFVMTDGDGRVLGANRAFLDLAHIASEPTVRGESLERWLGRSRVDFSVLMANLRQHGAVRLFSTTVTSEHGAPADVEVSASTVAGAEPPCIAFNIRNVGRRVGAEAEADVPRTVEQLTELVGRVPLRELVRDATDLVEKLCIEAALQLTQDNRASAAEVLGLSRQSLYVKLRRYGLIDGSSDGEESPAP
jgi:transcriptional regulator PpsR